MLFVDGVGLGDRDARTNPIVRAEMPVVCGLIGGPLAGREAVRTSRAALAPLGAGLGVPGVPQSATGQVAILTGENAAARVGRHVTASPGPVLRALLAERGLFVVLRRRGIGAALANAYAPEYLAAVASRRLRAGAIATNALQAGMPLRGIDDLWAGRAVSHDLSNTRLRDLGYRVPFLSPDAAGRRLGALARGQPFTLFEFFQTDLAGHGRLPAAVEVLERFDAFLGGVLAETDPAETLILVTSDHGNVEDERTAGHTGNPVPALLVGAAAGRVAGRLRTLTDLAPACLGLLAGEAGAA
jgi:2,3-bisphosphoglycerate-independent phosphoglycerate mutase